MDLEKRVQALENEVEILKNQIQETLLEIQAQILTNTHSSLRSEETAQVRPAPPAAPQPQSIPAQQQPPQQAMYTPPSAQAEPACPPPPPELPPEPPSPPDDRPEDEGPAPVVRKVSLDDLRASRPTQPLPEVDAPPPSPPDLPPPPNEDFLDERLSALARQAGVFSEQQAPFPDDECDSGQDDGALPLPPFVTENSPQALNDMDWATMNQLERWVAMRVQRMGPTRTRQLIKQYHQEGRYNAEVRKALLQLVSIIEADLHPERAPSPEAEPEPEPELVEDDGNTNVILRLIAGIQNAGVGVRRSDDHG